MQEINTEIHLKKKKNKSENMEERRKETKTKRISKNYHETNKSRKSA